MIFAGKLFMLWHEILLFAITNQVSSKSHSDVAAACVEKTRSLCLSTKKC